MMLKGSVKLPEGMCGRLLGEADVCTRSIEDALDLLIYPKRLVATLRG